MRHGSKPTIRDVAETAGVSLTTVSYVLSGRSGGTTRISQATQDRVHAAVRELGYVANRAARGMRRGRTELVAVAVADLEQPRDRAIATVLARILPEHGYQAVILLGGGWRQFMLSGGADGVIRTGAPETDDDAGDHGGARRPRRAPRCSSRTTPGPAAVLFRADTRWSPPERTAPRSWPSAPSLCCWPAAELGPRLGFQRGVRCRVPALRLSAVAASRRGRRASHAATIAPETLCHREKTADGSAASAPKCAVARVAARPEFCIPTSKARALRALSSRRPSLPAR